MYAQKGHTSRSNLSHERFWQQNEFLLPYPFCLCRSQRHAQIPQHSNLVLLPHTYTLLKSPIGPKKSFRPVEEQCKSRHPCILSWAGCPPSRPPLHWLSQPPSTNSNARGSGRGVSAPERAKHTRHQCPTGAL